MNPIDYYFSLVSPWAYLGHARFMALAERRQARVNFIPVDLGVVFAQSDGKPLAQRHPARVAYRMMELQRWRLKLGLNFALKPKGWPFDPTLANRIAVALAERDESPEPFVAQAFKAVFEQERNLGQENEIVAVLKRLGMDADAILTLAKSAQIDAAYRKNTENAFAAGVFGSPSYVREGEIFWGQDRLEALDDALKSGRAPFGGQ